jgi:peroxiredoxin
MSLLVNQKKIQSKKLQNKVGGDAHESRFGGDDRQMRKHKVMIAPSVNTNQCVRFEQAWNRQAERKDVVRISIGKTSAICERAYLEQALASMSQGDAILKYVPPTYIGK